MGEFPNAVAFRMATCFSFFSHSPPNRSQGTRPACFVPQKWSKGLATMFTLAGVNRPSHKKGRGRDHRKALVQLPDGGKFCANPVQPYYLRLPKAGQICPISSLNRSKLNRLILPTAAQPTPPVKSIVVPNSGGNKRGVRLILRESLLA